MCVLLSLILCLLKRLSNSHLLMSLVPVVDHSCFLLLLLSFRFFIILSVPPTVVGLPSSLFFLLFFSLFYLFLFIFYIYILLLLSHCTLTFLYHVFIPLVREEVRDKNIYMCMETKINFN